MKQKIKLILAAALAMWNAWKSPRRKSVDPAPISNEEPTDAEVLELFAKVLGDGYLGVDMGAAFVMRLHKALLSGASALKATQHEAVEIDREKQERCESALPDCGPVEYWDSEGVPLCRRCYNELETETETQQRARELGISIVAREALTIDALDARMPFTPVAWFDVFNAVVYFNREDAAAALAGGNNVHPVEKLIPAERAEEVEALAEEGLAYFERAGDPGDKKYVDAIRALLRSLAAKPQDFKNQGEDWFGDMLASTGVVIPLDCAKPQDDQDRKDAELHAEIARLNAIINSPQSDDFLRAVSTEAEHQRQRWPSDHDAGKTPADWFWLVGYVAGKALRAHLDGDIGKAEHHAITTAAVCANWHRAMLGITDMRPGIDGDAAMAQESGNGSASRIRTCDACGSGPWSTSWDPESKDRESKKFFCPNCTGAT